MRFVGSFLGAILVVSMLLAIGVRLFYTFDQERVELVFHEVDLLSEGQQRELSDVLGLAPGPEPLPTLADIPPLEFRRSVQGFVQLELTLDAAGWVRDAEVLGSTLPPVYHQKAIDIVRNQRYLPESGAAQPLGSRRLEIVEFRMDAPAAQ